MNRKVIAILFVATMVMSLAAIGTAAAKTTTEKIEFDLDSGVYVTFYPGEPEDVVDASAVLTGNIKNADGTYYISPLSGTITVDGVDHKIHVKSPKQSEPLFYFEDGYGEPGDEDYFKFQAWFTPVEVNINGDKYVGDLGWERYEDNDGVFGDSDLYFTGIVDGNGVECWLDEDI